MVSVVVLEWVSSGVCSASRGHEADGSDCWRGCSNRDDVEVLRVFIFLPDEFVCFGWFGDLMPGQIHESGDLAAAFTRADAPGLGQNSIWRTIWPSGRHVSTTRKGSGRVA